MLGTSLSAVLKTVWCYCWSQMGAKPPLSGGMITCCATELGVNGMVITKVIFTGHCAGLPVEVTAGGAAVDVQNIWVLIHETVRRKTWETAFPFPGELKYLRVGSRLSSFTFEHILHGDLTPPLRKQKKFPGIYESADDEIITKLEALVTKVSFFLFSSSTLI